MNFLKDELEGLPPVVVEAVLLQLESAVREAKHAHTMPYTNGHDLQCMAICAKIAQSLDFLRRFRQATEDESR